MRTYRIKTISNTRLRLSKQASGQRQKQHEARCAALKRATSARPLSLSDVLFNLQQQYGNHFVQRITEQGNGFGTFGYHELAHFNQQPETASSMNHLPPIVQRQTGPTARSTLRASSGTPTDVMFYIMNPSSETDRGLQAALNLLNRYSSHVSVTNVEIRLLPESERRSTLSRDLRLGGDSFWDGNTPVVRLPQTALSFIAQHIAGNAQVADVHTVIRTIGHEMHHLWRERERHRANPLQPIYETEAARRLEQVRQNWLRSIQNGSTQIAGVPRTITRWGNIPRRERERIERGASRTDYIRGLYERSAYIVEEIYTRIEELAFLRIQQRHESASGRTPSRIAVSALAGIIYRLKNMMESMVGPNSFVTPQLWRQTRRAMLTYLRQRYPNRRNPQVDSFEVLFYLSAMHGGRPPLFVAGLLQSASPPGARTP